MLIINEGQESRNSCPEGEAPSAEPAAIGTLDSTALVEYVSAMGEEIDCLDLPESVSAVLDGVEDLLALKPASLTRQRVFSVLRYSPSQRYKLKKLLLGSPKAEDSKLEDVLFATLGDLKSFMAVFGTLSEKRARAGKSVEWLLELMPGRLAEVSLGSNAYSAELLELVRDRQALDGGLPGALNPVGSNYQLGMRFHSALAAEMEAGRIERAAELLWWMALDERKVALITVGCLVYPELRDKFPHNPPPLSAALRETEALVAEMVGRLNGLTRRVAMGGLTIDALRELTTLFQDRELFDLAMEIARLGRPLTDTANAIQNMTEWLDDSEIQERSKAFHAGGPLLPAALFEWIARDLAWLCLDVARGRAAERETLALRERIAEALTRGDFREVSKLSAEAAERPPGSPGRPHLRDRVLRLLDMCRDLACQQVLPVPDAPDSPRAAEAVGARVEDDRMSEALRQAEAERDDARSESEALRAEVALLRRERNAARSALRKAMHARDSLTLAIEGIKKADGRGDDAVQRPACAAEVASWAEKVLAGRLEIHPRARAELKKTIFEDAALLADALELLAGPYRDMKLPSGGGADKRAEVERLAESLGVEVSLALAGGRQNRDSRLTVERSGEKILLDMHVKRGTAMDHRRTLRIYFTWLAAEQLILVGSMPEHITTRVSN